MLKLLSDKSAVLNVDDFYIFEKMSGLDELIFSMSIYDENYPHVLEEAVIEYEQPYLVKAIDAGKDTAKIKCQLNLDELKADMKIDYSNQSATLAETVNGILPAGWIFADNSGSTIRRTIEGNLTPLEIIQECASTYDVVFRFDVAKRIVRAYTLTAFQPLGAFASRELNLTEVNFKGKSTGFFTRLYAYGKDGLSFASINDGKPYVDFNGYSNKVICAYWQDERYTIAENLLEAAKAAVKEGGTPQRSYECTVYDLAATNPELYSWQDFSLFSIVRLIDDIKDLSTNYQVVEYWRYPYYPEKNVVTLSSTAPKIQNTIKDIKFQIENPNSSFQQGIQNLLNALGDSIAGFNGGNLLITQNEKGQPNGLKIMDTADEATAKKVLYFNLEGIAYSSNGANGPFDSVWSFEENGFVANWIVVGKDEATAKKVLYFNLEGIAYSSNGANGPFDSVWSFEENGFVANWIVVGNLTANIIKGGTLTLGGPGNGNGVCSVLDAAGRSFEENGFVANWIVVGNLTANIIKGGTLTLGGPGNGNGVCSVLDAAGNEVAKINSGGVNIRKGSINVNAEDYRYNALSVSYDLGDPGSINQKCRNFIGTTGIVSRWYGVLGDGTSGIFETEIGGGRIYLATYSGGTVDSPDYASRNSLFTISVTSLREAQMTITGNVSIGGNLAVFNGTKNRAVKTEHYGTRLMNAYETADALFGDIGQAEIGEDGKCMVEIDPIFSETVSLDYYIVFLQAEGRGECFVSEKNADCFVVEGTPGLLFAYEIKAKQKGFESVRLEEKS